MPAFIECAPFFLAALRQFCQYCCQMTVTSNLDSFFFTFIILLSLSRKLISMENKTKTAKPKSLNDAQPFWTVFRTIGTTNKEHEEVLQYFAH